MSLQLTPERFRALHPAQSTSPAMARRLNAIGLLVEGITISEVAQQLQVSRRSVYAWRHHFLQQGIDGLADHPHPGRRLSVDAAYIACLETTLEDPRIPEPDGGWKIDSLQQHLAEQTGQTLSTGRLYVLLRKLGYVPEQVVVKDRREIQYVGHQWRKGRRRDGWRWKVVINIDDHRRRLQAGASKRWSSWRG